MEWSPEAWIALAGFVFTLILSIITITTFVRKIKEEITQTTLAYERKLAQSDAGLRAVMTEMGFFMRDNYVHNDVFDKMIDMAAAANENQFRAMAEALNRITDRLDAIQAEIHRSRP